MRLPGFSLAPLVLVCTSGLFAQEHFEDTFKRQVTIGGCWEIDYFDDGEPDYDTDKKTQSSALGLPGGAGISASETNKGYFSCSGTAWDQLTPGQITLNTDAFTYYEERWNHPCDGGHARFRVRGRAVGEAEILEPGGGAYAVGFVEVKCQQLFDEPVRATVTHSAVAWENGDVINIVMPLAELTPAWRVGSSRMSDQDTNGEDQAECVGSYLTIIVRSKTRNGVHAEGTAVDRSRVRSCASGVIDRWVLELKDECD